MLMKSALRLSLSVLLLVAVSPAIAQVAPAAKQGGPLPVVIGVGFSNYSMDWGPGRRMNGITAWVDLYPFPGDMRELGFELEGRDLNYLHPVTNLREDTGLIGPIYSWTRYRRVHPYIKFLAGVGSMDFPPPQGFPYYTHDTFLVTSPGGGFDAKIRGHLWVRADYQYQYWHHVLGPHDSNPNGFTIGAQWDFRHSD
jgi:hypothetical protein